MVYFLSGYSTGNHGNHYSLLNPFHSHSRVLVGIRVKFLVIVVRFLPKLEFINIVELLSVYFLRKLFSLFLSCYLRTEGWTFMRSYWAPFCNFYLLTSKNYREIWIVFSRTYQFSHLTLFSRFSIFIHLQETLCFYEGRTFITINAKSHSWT
jgi:hypothetical protein